VTHQDHASTAIKHGTNRWQCHLDPSIIRDILPFIQGDVKIDADQDFLAVNVDLSDAFFWHGRSLQLRSKIRMRAKNRSGILAGGKNEPAIDEILCRVL
jgi:hypothetical protein